MCDVHLIEEVNEERTATAPIRCVACRKKIKAGERHRRVERASRRRISWAVAVAGTT